MQSIAGRSSRAMDSEKQWARARHPWSANRSAIRRHRLCVGSPTFPCTPRIPAQEKPLDELTRTLGTRVARTRDGCWQVVSEATVTRYSLVYEFVSRKRRREGAGRSFCWLLALLKSVIARSKKTIEVSAGPEDN